MNNPKVAAALTAIVGLWQLYSIFSATESPSTALAVLQWVIVAGCAAGFIGAVRQLSSQG